MTLSGLGFKSLLLRSWFLAQRALLPLGLSHSRKLNGHRIYFDPATDVGIHLTILGRFEKQALAICGRYIKPDSVVVDVGANIGTHTVQFSQFAPDGTVISLEPARSTFALLLKNVRNLGNVIPLNIALSNACGIQSFFVASDNAYSGLKDTRQKPILRQELVACHTGDELLSQLLGERRIDFIKIDVEGFELQVLQGMQTLIRKHRPVIFCEIKSCGGLQNPNPEGTVDFCVSLGYEALVVDGAELRPAGPPDDRYYNYLFIPKRAE
jgi:FkbM family methyltransferase